MKKLFLIYICIAVTTTASAQLFEVGGFLGGSNYIGDIGSTKYINPNTPAIGGIAKFNYTPRITFRGTLTYTSHKFDDSKAESTFRIDRNLSVPRNRMLEAAAGIEFHFFKYSLSRIGYSQTPYIFVEAGLSHYHIASAVDEIKRTTTFVFPFGVGYKMRLARNVGIGFETSFRYTFKDVIDYNNHAIADSNYNFGNPESDDWYVFTGVTLVYAFGRPGCFKENEF